MKYLLYTFPSKMCRELYYESGIVSSAGTLVPYFRPMMYKYGSFNWVEDS